MAYTDEQILDGLQAAAETHGQPLSVTQYDAYAAGHDVVGRVRIIQRFGTWNDACLAAGLDVNAAQRAYGKKWSTTSVLPFVAAYLGEATKPSYAGYTAWAREAAGAPSAQTVRNLFGSWSAATKAALGEDQES